MTVTTGSTRATVQDANGFSVYEDSHDWLFSTADLILEGAATLPQPGDKITDTIGSDVVVFEVAPVADSECYRYCDAYRRQIRAHSKRIGTA